MTSQDVRRAGSLELLNGLRSIRNQRGGDVEERHGASRGSNCHRANQGRTLGRQANSSRDTKHDYKRGGKKSADGYNYKFTLHILSIVFLHQDTSEKQFTKTTSSVPNLVIKRRHLWRERQKEKANKKLTPHPSTPYFSVRVTVIPLFALTPGNPVIKGESGYWSV